MLGKFIDKVLKEDEDLGEEIKEEDVPQQISLMVL